MAEAIELLISEITEFIKLCDIDFLNEKYDTNNMQKANYYLNRLKNIKYTSNYIEAQKNKLTFIHNQIKSHSNMFINDEAMLSILPISISDYIINLVKDKKLTNPTLIARFVYIELAKVVYYDVSYIRQDNPEAKRLICEAKFDVKKEKIFSYLVCTQWLKLYTYILNQFGINVEKRNIPGQDHVWGEIKINNNQIILVDATDYIGSSIDLSNAKSNSETAGFAVVPKELSGLRVSDILTNSSYKEQAKILKKQYEFNKDLDIHLGYIDEHGYEIDKIISQYEIFNSNHSILRDPEDVKKFLEESKTFFRKIKIPNNMDGYELYAYYNRFLKRLPLNVAFNISLQTMYADALVYKQRKMEYKLFTAPKEYITYLENLIYDTYYKYVGTIDNPIIEDFKGEKINSDELSRRIATCEMKIAEINRNLNLYYAINRLHFYTPCTGETDLIQLYEPTMGKKHLKNNDELTRIKKRNGISS